MSPMERMVAALTEIRVRAERRARTTSTSFRNASMNNGNSTGKLLQPESMGSMSLSCASDAEKTPEELGNGCQDPKLETLDIFQNDLEVRWTVTDPEVKRGEIK